MMTDQAIYQSGNDMISDEQIQKGLDNSCIPKFVCGTTLLKEEAPDLRKIVAERLLVRPTGLRGVFMHPKSKGTTEKARRLFYVLAKELHLSGISVHCIPAFRLVEHLSSQEFSVEMERVDSVKIVFILDFYEKGAPNPYSPHQSALLRTWLRERFESGKAACFLSDVPLEASAAWWADSIIGFIGDNTLIQAI